MYVDDATSELMELSFAAVESTFDYFRATRRYLERHGKPMAFYSDRLSVFHVHARDTAQSGPGVSQFGRALRDLNIDSLCAPSPEAKGRVERANGTLQDRLVKELCLRGLNDPTAAEPFLPAFMADYKLWLLFSFPDVARLGATTARSSTPRPGLHWRVRASREKRRLSIT